MNDKMQYRYLGKSNLEISFMGLGTMNLGEKANEKESHDILNKAIDSGINFVDTANVYGRRVGTIGLSESIIGNWLHSHPSLRNEIVLASKVYGKTGEGPNKKGLSAYHIIQACEASLKRLKTDRIDLFQFHHLDRNANWDEIWQAGELLCQQGKVLYWGSSNFPAWEIARASETAKKKHHLGLISEQTFYNPLERIAELEVIPACQVYDVGLIAYSPLHRGLLRGNTKNNLKGQLEKPDIKLALAYHHERIEKFEALAKKRNWTPVSLAIRWMLENPLLSSVLIGPRNLDQLNGYLEGLSLPWDQQIQKEMEELFKPTYGRVDKKRFEAPEAYAW